MFAIQTYVKMVEWELKILNTKQNKAKAVLHPRSFTDEEVLALRADWAASGLTVRNYVMTITNPKAALITYKQMLHGYSYKYLPMPA